MQEYVPRVFISSRFDEFRELKDHLKAELRNGRGGTFAVIDFDERNAHEQAPVQLSIRAARTCDVMLVLLGSTYGPSAPGHKLSYVELECEAALKKGGPMILPHFFSEGAEDGQGDTRLLALRKRMQNHKYAAFSSEEDPRAIAREIKLNLIDRWMLTSSTERLQGVDLSMIEDELAGVELGDGSEADRRIEKEARLALDEGTETWPATRLAANPALVAAAEQKREAQRAMEMREWTLAAEHLNRALRHRPWDLAALYWAARVRMVKGEREGARHALVLARKAIRIAEKQTQLQPAGTSDIPLAAVCIVAARAAETVGLSHAGLGFAQRAVNAANTYWVPKFELARQAALAGDKSLMRRALRAAFSLKPVSLLSASLDPGFREVRGSVRRLQEEITADIRPEVREILRCEHELAARTASLVAILPQGTSVMKEETVRHSFATAEQELTTLDGYSLLTLLDRARKSFDRQLQLLRAIGAQALALAAHEPSGPAAKQKAETEHAKAARRIAERRDAIRKAGTVQRYQRDQRVARGGLLSACALGLLGLVISWFGHPFWGLVAFGCAIWGGRSLHKLADTVGRERAVRTTLGALTNEMGALDRKLRDQLGKIAYRQDEVSAATKRAVRTFLDGVARFETAALKRRIYCPTAAIDRAAVGSLLLLSPAKHATIFTFRGDLLPVRLQKWADVVETNAPANHLYVRSNLQEDGKPVVSRLVCYFPEAKII